MRPFDCRVDGLSYDAILAALVDQQPSETTRTLRNRARFIAERALEQPYEHRHDFVNRKIWENV